MRETLDVTGEVCPRPALIVRDTLEDLEPGDELVVNGDYPPAEGNIRRTCEKHGYDVATGEAEAEDSFSLTIAVPDEAVGPMVED
jgi:tRNA 2-thiouridine synthesizing protein A